MSTVTRGQSPLDRYESRRRSHAVCPLEFRATVKSIRDRRLEERQYAWERTRRWALTISLILAAVITLAEYTL